LTKCWRCLRAARSSSSRAASSSSPTPPPDTPKMNFWLCTSGSEAAWALRPEEDEELPGLGSK